MLYIERYTHSLNIFVKIKKDKRFNYYITFYYVILYQFISQVSLYTNKNKICKVIFNYLIENQNRPCMKTEESHTLFLTFPSKPRPPP